MQNSKPIVGITQGDSNGIGYEVIIKALADPRILESFIPVIYGSSKIFGFYKKTINEIGQIDTNVITSASEAHAKRINIVNCIPDSSAAEPGTSTPDSSRAAIVSLETAVKDLEEGKIDALVTAPINKKAMSEEGFRYTGHTEYLQSVFAVDDVAMFMVSDRLKVGVVTGHIPLKDVAGNISVQKILSKLHLMKSSLQRDFGVDEPKIGVLSLNPHSGDGGLLGKEEQEIIIPAIQAAQAEGILAFGPYSPDGYFALGQYDRFDATLAMYHDQGLEPFKALVFNKGVNYTAGLPVVRTSPDHGTAFDTAGMDKADPSSMIAAIYMAVDIVKKREEYDALVAGRLKEKPAEYIQGKNGRPQIA